MNKVGILGGTFDPIHCGHLDVAEAAARALELDRVWLMPANLPPHRAVPQASAPHRFAMAALAILGHPRLALLDLEMLSPDPSYTSASLDRLEARGIETKTLFLITGADAFRDIGSWKDYPAILERAHFVAVSRPQTSVSTLSGHLPALAARMIDPPAPGAPVPPSSIVLVDAPTAPVSSTEVRRRVQADESLAGLVPELVAGYIRTHHLYTRIPTHGQI